MPNLNTTLDALAERLNQHQQWVSLEPHPTADGLTQVQITINGHFATVPVDEDPQAAIEAIVDLFGGMSVAVADAAERVTQSENRKKLQRNDALQVG